MEIIEGNKLIAEFMGDKPMPHPYDYEVNCFYHCKWDWLMPVVEKISNINIKGHQPYTSDQYVRLEIVPSGYVRIDNLRDTPVFTNVSIEGSLIMAVWKAVVKFIQWYNSINPQTP